jgi:hypothetical protein
MNDKSKTGKIGRVSATDKTKQVDRAQAVDGIQQVKAASAIERLKGVGGASMDRRATKTMSPEERERVLRMIREEADKLFSDGLLPASQKELVQQAVLMAVDSGIIVEEKNEPSSKTNKPPSK